MSKFTKIFLAVVVAQFSTPLWAQQKFEEVVQLKTPIVHNGGIVLAVTAQEQKDNFVVHGTRCISYNRATDMIGSERADLYCKIYLKNEKAISVTGKYSPSGDEPVFDPKTNTTRHAESNSGNFYCLYFVDAVFDELTCGIPKD